MPHASPLEGSPEALYATVYAELKRLARRHLRGRPGATLSTTDLVHEAYLKLASPSRDWENRAHFFGAASQAMRDILVDYARRRRAAKRGGGAEVTTLTTGDAAFEVQLDDLLALDEALDRLKTLSERLHQVVELRFYAGLSAEEISEVLAVSARTVERDWAKAKLYLSREMGP